MPGIAGSRLNYDTPPDTSEKWPNTIRYALPGEDAPLRDLKLAPNGEDPFSVEDEYRPRWGTS